MTFKPVKSSDTKSTNGPDVRGVCDFVVKAALDVFTQPTVILFGSRARGNAKPTSDFDFAIEAPGATYEMWVRFRDVVGTSAPTLLPIDLVNLKDDIEDSLRASVKAEGKILLLKGGVSSKSL